MVPVWCHVLVPVSERSKVHTESYAKTRWVCDVPWTRGGARRGEADQDENPGGYPRRPFPHGRFRPNRYLDLPRDAKKRDAAREERPSDL